MDNNSAANNSAAGSTDDIVAKIAHDKVEHGVGKKAANSVNRRSATVRQWRVGTFSMGIALIALGLFLIFARVYELPVMWYVVKWWPLLLVLLGLEMVVYNLLANAQKSALRFTYDIFSIFLVAVFLCFSAAFYFVETAGVIAMAQKFLLSAPQVVEAEKIAYPVSDHLQALSLEVESGTLNLRAYDGDNIKVSVIYKGHFLSREEAEAFAADQYIKQELLGDTLSLRLFKPAVAHHFFNHPAPEQEVTVFIPEGIDVEVLRAWGHLQLHLREVKNNWDISFEGGNSTITIEQASNFSLQAEILQHGSIEGNITWDQLETKHKDDSDRVRPHLHAVKKWGEAERSITLRQQFGTAEIIVKNQD